MKKHSQSIPENPSSLSGSLQLPGLQKDATDTACLGRSGALRQRGGVKRSFLVLLLILCCGVPGFANLEAEPEAITPVAIENRATELEALNPAEARQRIQEMTLAEALSVYDVLVSRARAKGVGPQVFYVAEQIQMIKATEASHRQLESLYWVIALTLLLFAAYLTYVLVDQRRIYRKIADRTEKTSSVSETVAPYRGESDGDS